MLSAPEDILHTLGEHASQYRFPLLDDPRIALLAGRLRCFSIDTRWAIAFEWLVFSEAELAFPLDLYVYGPLAGPGSFALHQVEGLTLDPDSWTAKSEWDPGPVVMIRSSSSRFQVRSDARDPEALCFSHGDMATEVTFGRAAIRELGHRVVIPDRVLLDTVPALVGATELVRLSDWDHPDITAGQSPRDSQSLVACAQLLSERNGVLAYSHSHDNVRAATLQ